MTVTQRQHLLAYLGYYPGRVDGDWGPQSQKACWEFQEDFGGITVDGFGGPETDKAMKHAVAYDMFKPEPASEQEASGPDPGAAEDWWDEIEYFEPPEIACQCWKYRGPYCDGYPHEMQKLTMQIADRARKHFGHPISIISGLRCHQHNADSNGVENSQHMYGEALDVYCYGVSQQTALDWFLSQPEVRYAYAIPNSGNIHFDIYPVGR